VHVQAPEAATPWKGPLERGASPLIINFPFVQAPKAATPWEGLLEGEAPSLIINYNFPSVQAPEAATPWEGPLEGGASSYLHHIFTKWELHSTTEECGEKQHEVSFHNF
jgi:hypothetical protein